MEWNNIEIGLKCWCWWEMNVHMGYEIGTECKVVWIAIEIGWEEERKWFEMKEWNEVEVELKFESNGIEVGIEWKAVWISIEIGRKGKGNELKWRNEMK